MVEAAAAVGAAAWRWGQLGSGGSGGGSVWWCQQLDGSMTAAAAEGQWQVATALRGLNNQVRASTTTAMETATMTATTNSENEVDGGCNGGCSSTAAAAAAAAVAAA